MIPQDLQVIGGLIIAIIMAFVFKNVWILESYMDEIFHIPQAQLYCQGNFHDWNPKITTFPGLYLFSTLSFRILTIFTNSSNVSCNAFYLRTINFLCSLSIPVLAKQCRCLIAGKDSQDYIPLIIFFYPLIFFYSYLYYTDNLSIAFSLVTYLLVLQIKSVQSVFSQVLLLLGSIAFLLIRQTNVIWLLFYIGITIVQDFRMRKRILDDRLGVKEFLSFLYYMWVEKVQLLSLVWPLLLPVIGFVIFVIYNGSIVVGDKENHAVGIHPAMISHAILLSTFLSLPITFDEILNCTKSRKDYLVNRFKIHQISKYGWIMYLMASIGVVSMLIFGSKSHPFLLSDNRHYSFYLWQRVLSHQKYRMILSPIYFLSSMYFFLNIQSHRGPLWFLIFVIAMVLALIPTPLFEPRYFTQVIVFALLNQPAVSTPSNASRKRFFSIFQMIALIGLSVINVGLLYIYLFRTFTWVDGSLARFMF